MRLPRFQFCKKTDTREKIATEKWEAGDTADGMEKDQKYRGDEISGRMVHIRAREENDVLLLSIK